MGFSDSNYSYEILQKLAEILSELKDLRAVRTQQQEEQKMAKSDKFRGVA